MLARSRILHKNFNMFVKSLIIKLQSMNFLKVGLLQEHVCDGFICSSSQHNPCKQMRRQEEEQQQVRKRNKTHLVIRCCLKNCACISSLPPLHVAETPYILSFSTDLK